MANVAPKTQKARPSSLPQLAIPPSIAPAPELISPTSRSNFLSFCSENGFAPPTTEEGIRVIDENTLLNEYDPEAVAMYESYPSPTATILFTPRDDLDIKDLKLDREDIKKNHERCMAKMKTHPKDRQVIAECREWRERQEKVEKKISAILEQKKVRRTCRQDLNKTHKKSEGW
ncbi:hypothetical protein F4810DRAFT_707628 [Camillea tinctor]|nr:hypothetical protein F4810DRAFT_707628 [Camillea tinctor]